MLEHDTPCVGTDVDALASFKDACLIISSTPKFPLDYVVRRVRREHPELTDEQIGGAEAGYRIFLSLCKLNPEEKIRPPKLVDEIWHAHVLHTRKYERDCHSYFGYFLHHSPDQEGTSIYQEGVPMSKWIAMGNSTPVLGINADCQGDPSACTSCGSGCNGGGT